MSIIGPSDPLVKPRLLPGLAAFQEYFRSRIAITSAMAPSRASQTTVAPDYRTAAEALAGAKPSAAAWSMERSLASSPAQ